MLEGEEVRGTDDLLARTEEAAERDGHCQTAVRFERGIWPPKFGDRSRRHYLPNFFAVHSPHTRVVCAKESMRGVRARD